MIAKPPFDLNLARKQSTFENQSSKDEDEGTTDEEDDGILLNPVLSASLFARCQSSNLTGPQQSSSSADTEKEKSQEKDETEGDGSDGGKCWERSFFNR